jgi:hypothetical protein
VIGITVDDENFGITARLAEFVKFARRADRGPQARKSCAKDKDPRHAPSPNLRCFVDMVLGLSAG